MTDNATLAVISLGTNTVRLLVARERGRGRLEELEHRQQGTRLGEGLHDGGALAPAAVERTLAVAREFAVCARSHAAPLSAIATSAVRRADDREQFAARVRDVTGVPLRVLDGETEAACTFAGATADAPRDGRCIAVVDVGGGSTECAVGTAGRLERARSLEIGSVRLSERFPALLGGDGAGEFGARQRSAAHSAAAEARHAAVRTLAPFAGLAPVDEVRAVAGTATTLAAVSAGCDVAAVAGFTLTRAMLDGVLERLLDLDLAARRRLPGMLAQRADIIVGGLLVLSEVLRALDASAARVERNDLLLGYLLSLVAA